MIRYKYFELKATFNAALATGLILPDDIVFIGDSLEIYTKDKYFLAPTGGTGDFVTVRTPQTVLGAKTFTNTTLLDRAILNPNKKMNSFYANPQASIWETCKLDIVEPNLFRKFDTEYIDITASLTDDQDDWDASLIRSMNSKPLLTSVDGTAYVQARIRENDLPNVKRVKIEITCDPTSGQVSGVNSRMWLTNLCILGNTTRATHKMSMDIFRDGIWTPFMRDTTRSKSAEFIDHICHPQINFGTGATATDYTRIRIIFYDFIFLANVQATSDFQLRKIWWFGSYPNKINKPTTSEDLDGNITTIGNIITPEGKLASEAFVRQQIPEPYEPNVIDVSNMFTTSTDADTSAFMFKRENGKHLIKLHGFDNSLTDNDLAIVPVLGFGPQYSSYQVAAQTLDGVNFTNYAIHIEGETNETEGRLTVPNGVQTFDVNYYLHDGTNTLTSYYIDTNNIMHPFNLDNTPIANFCGTSNSITINGLSVLKINIKEIIFGVDYLSINNIPDYFLNDFESLTSVSLSGFSNVMSIGTHFINNCAISSIDLSPLTHITNIPDYFLILCTLLTDLDLTPLASIISVGEYFLAATGITSIDLSSLIRVTIIRNNFLYGCRSLVSISLTPLSNVTVIEGYFMADCPQLAHIDCDPLANVTSIGMYFLSACSSLVSLNLAPLINVTTIGRYFLNQCLVLSSINIGSEDWSSKNIELEGLMMTTPNSPECILYADTPELGNIFKEKMVGAVSDWTIMINP